MTHYENVRSYGGLYNAFRDDTISSYIEGMHIQDGTEG